MQNKVDELINLSQDDKISIYRRSLCFIFVKAIYDLFPDRKVKLSHSVSNGLYCEVYGSTNLSYEETVQIEARMHEISNMAIPFVKHSLSFDEARVLLEKCGRMDYYKAITYRTEQFVTLFSCDGFYDYFYGTMLPDTSYIDIFSLKYYPPGLILLSRDAKCPEKQAEFKEQTKLFTIYTEYKHWVKVLGFENVGALNNIVKNGNINDVILVSEALQEKKIAEIADLITNSKDKKSIVLISGPSSSGKTTFAHRLSIQLRVNGIRPVTISLDDYFLNRENTPKDEKGEFDFEALEALDISLFNKHLAALINGDEIEIPIFNFAAGCREVIGKKLKISNDQVLVIEGIHGLNEKLTELIPRSSKFKIYVSALTSISIDDHNRVPTTDTRKIRRIVRDHQFRGISAISTIKRWPSVRLGEEKNIFPFQEEADAMFNSSLPYELGVLRTLIEPLLSQISQDNNEYAEAKRLNEFLSYFLPIEQNEIPANSIVREFIGKKNNMNF